MVLGAKINYTELMCYFQAYCELSAVYCHCKLMEHKKIPHIAYAEICKSEEHYVKDVKLTLVL